MPFNTTTFIAALVGTLLLGSIGGMLFASTKSEGTASSSVTSADPIFTSSVNIVNKEGKVRAILGLWDGEHPALIMGDAQCDRRTSLAVYGKERTGVTLYGKDCKRRVALEVQSDDLPTLVLRDHLDNPRVQVVLNQDGSPLVRLFDSKGKALWETP